MREVGAQQHDKWLYLTYQDNQMAMLRNLVATWLELAIVEGLSLSEEPAAASGTSWTSWIASVACQAYARA